jgi:hypothetical protein
MTHGPSGQHLYSGKEEITNLKRFNLQTNGECQDIYKFYILGTREVVVPVVVFG